MLISQPFFAAWSAFLSPGIPVWADIQLIAGNRLKVFYGCHGVRVQNYRRDHKMCLSIQWLLLVLLVWASFQHP